MWGKILFQQKDTRTTLPLLIMDHPFKANGRFISIRSSPNNEKEPIFPILETGQDATEHGPFSTRIEGEPFDKNHNFYVLLA